MGSLVYELIWIPLFSVGRNDLFCVYCPRKLQSTLALLFNVIVVDCTVICGNMFYQLNSRMRTLFKESQPHHAHQSNNIHASQYFPSEHMQGYTRKQHVQPDTGKTRL